MNEKIIRLTPTEETLPLIELTGIHGGDRFINVYRFEYSDDIGGYFLRSKRGTAVVINENNSAAEQAATIKTIIKGLENCPSSELGLVKADGRFVCGGSCCRK